MCLECNTRRCKSKGANSKGEQVYSGRCGKCQAENPFQSGRLSMAEELARMSPERRQGVLDEVQALLDAS